MIYNYKTKKWTECYYRKIDLSEVGEYVPPKWVFDFKKDFEEGFEVFTLETFEYPGEVQGIVALKVNKAEYTVHLKSAECADCNKYHVRGLKRNGVNKDRIYTDVGYNLVAFACQYSLEQGCDGHMNLTSKTDTIPYYLRLGGKQFKEGSQMILFDEPIGQSLAATKFPGGVIKWLN